MSRKKTPSPPQTEIAPPVVGLGDSVRMPARLAAAESLLRDLLACRGSRWWFRDRFGLTELLGRVEAHFAEHDPKAGS